MTDQELDLIGEAIADATRPLRLRIEELEKALAVEVEVRRRLGNQTHDETYPPLGRPS